MTLARSITFAAGVALLLLSAGLARRKRRAWLLAIALVAFAAVAHLARGASTSSRRSAASRCSPRSSALRRPVRRAPAIPTSLRPLARRYGRHRRRRGRRSPSSAGRTRTGSPTPASRCCWPAAPSGRSTTGCARTASPPGRPTPTAPAPARLVADYGRDSLSFFSLRADRRYRFSRAGNAFLAYRVVAGCALVAGDPIGAAAEIPGLVEDFGALCRERGWRMVVLHTSAEWLDLYRRRGMRAVRDRRRGRAAAGDLLARGPRRCARCASR